MYRTKKIKRWHIFLESLFLVLVILSFTACESENRNPTEEGSKNMNSAGEDEKNSVRKYLSLSHDMEIYVKNTLKQHEFLPVLYVSSVKYEDISASIEQIFNFIKDDEGSLWSSDSHKKDMLHESEEITYWNENWIWGEGRPWYDREYFYEVKEKARVLFLRYALKSYCYIESLMDIYSEMDQLGEEYAWKDVPEKDIKLTQQVIESLGITASREKCYFLSRQCLQNLYDKISENNAFRDERWSAPEDKSAYKTRSDTAKKDVWTKEDEFWCLELQQEINGLTVNESAAIVLLNENEVMYLSLTGILPGEYIERETQGLMEYTEIISKLQEITNGLFKDGAAAGETAEISDLKLEYVCTDISAGVYRPVWEVTITYDIKTENGSLDEADTDILIDAITGTEIINGSAGKEMSDE